MNLRRASMLGCIGMNVRRYRGRIPHSTDEILHNQASDDTNQERYRNMKSTARVSVERRYMIE